MDNKKSLIALALVALIGIVGGTYAYFTTTSKLTNEFTTGTYSTSVTEEFTSPDNWTPGTTTTKKVNVKNNGSVPIVARAIFTEKWTAASGANLALTRDGVTVALFDVNANWVYNAADGYYYYNTVLNTNGVSADFISEVTFNPDFALKETTFDADGNPDVVGDITCTKDNKEGTGTTTITCANETSGYAGATYTLDITIETVQADQAAQVWTQGGSYIPGNSSVPSEPATD